MRLNGVEGRPSHRTDGRDPADTPTAPHRKPLPLLTFERPRSATKLSIVGEPQIVTLTYLVQHYFHRPQPWFQTPVACLYFHCQRRVLFPAPRSTIPFEARCLPSSGEIRHMRQGSRCSSLRRPSHGKPSVERTPLRTPAFSVAFSTLLVRSIALLDQSTTADMDQKLCRPFQLSPINGQRPKVPDLRA